MNKYRTNNFESCGQIALWVLRKLGLFFYGQNLEINTQSHFQFEYLEVVEKMLEYSVLSFALFAR